MRVRSAAKVGHSTSMLLEVLRTSSSKKSPYHDIWGIAHAFSPQLSQLVVSRLYAIRSPWTKNAQYPQVLKNTPIYLIWVFVHENTETKDGQINDFRSISAQWVMAEKKTLLVFLGRCFVAVHVVREIHKRIPDSLRNTE